MSAVPQAVEEDEIPAPIEVPEEDDATPEEESDAASEEPEDALP